MKLTDEEYKAMCQAVIRHGEERKNETNYGKNKFKADDFLCGAMACMDALGINVPVSWPFAIISGVNVIRTQYEKVKEADVKDLPLMLETITDYSAKELLTKRLKEGK